MSLRGGDSAIAAAPESYAMPTCGVHKREGSKAGRKMAHVGIMLPMSANKEDFSARVVDEGWEIGFKRQVA